MPCKDLTFVVPSLWSLWWTFLSCTIRGTDIKYHIQFMHGSKKLKKKKTAYRIHSKRKCIWMCRSLTSLKEIEIKIIDHRIHPFFPQRIISTFEYRSKRSKDWSAGAIYGPSPCKKILSLFCILSKFFMVKLNCETKLSRAAWAKYTNNQNPTYSYFMWVLGSTV